MEQLARDALGLLSEEERAVLEELLSRMERSLARSSQEVISRLDKFDEPAYD